MKQKYFFLLIIGFLPLNALKIDRVILATDNNPAYIEFWPVVAKAWKERIGVQPTLALIAPSDVRVDESLGDVIRFEPLPDIPTSLQAQTIRLLLPAYFPDEVSIISDIDMIPLNKEYFVDSVADAPDDAFVVYREVAEIPKFPMCYVAAKGSTFKDIFQVHSVHDIGSIITYWHSLNIGWSTDEMVMYHSLLQWPKYAQKCIKLGHGVQRRIDRYWGLEHDDQLLEQGYYIDAHCPRPYSAYKKEIDALIKTSRSQNKSHQHEKKPKVSIITSLFKGDDFIVGFLSDITRQTIFNECELIIINANSPGHEEPIIREYMQRFPNIVYKKLDHDPGLYAVWNMAIKMARADLITNANVDDRRNPESLEVQARALEEDPTVDLVYSNCRVTYTPNETFESNTGECILCPSDFSSHRMFCCLPGPQPMWRKSMHEKCGLFDESFQCGGDFEMWNRAVYVGSQFKKIPGQSGVFYVNPKGLSTDIEKKSIQEAELGRICEKYASLWRMPHFFCTAADSNYFPHLLNLIGSIHETSFDALGAIAVFDLGLTEEQIQHLNTIEKVSVHKIEMTHADLLTRFKTSHSGKVAPGWYAWKFVVLKQALEMFPYVLWVDSGTTILKPLDSMFKYILESGYFLATIGDEKINKAIQHPIRWGATEYVKQAFDLSRAERAYVLEKEPLLSGTIGVSRKAVDYLVGPLYSLTNNLRLFEDDGTTPHGFGTGRHDQAILSIFAYLHGLTVHRQDHTQETPLCLNVAGKNEEVYITWNGSCVNEKTHLYNSRGDLSRHDHYSKAIRRTVREPERKDDESKKPKIVALVPGRNEAVLLHQHLKALSLFVDAIVYLDDASDDSSMEILQSIAAECKIERIMRKDTWYRDEPGDRNKLLAEGRAIGGTHFVVLDVDEMFTANCLDNNFLRNAILSLNPGDQLGLVWIQLWRSLDVYRFDDSVWTWNYKNFIFCDDKECFYSSDFLHTSRSPWNLKGKSFIIHGYEHGVLHFQFVNWRNVVIKHCWYRCLEHIRNPSKSISDINALYGASLNEANLKTVKSPDAWFSNYAPFFNPTLYSKPEGWRESEIQNWFSQYGKNFFESLDIWNIDWGLTLTNQCQ